MTKDNFSALADMIYSGRGITVGQTPSGNSFIGYSLTGRSPSSQARRLVKDHETGVIRTSVTDKEQLEKGSPALLIYPAIVPLENDILIASNGSQTKLIYSEAKITQSKEPTTLLSAFKFPLFPFYEYDEKGKRWIDVTTYEPDSPNNTPRINACIIGGKTALCIVREEGGRAVNKVYSFQLVPGKGKLITTYSGGNEKPLAPFQGEPLDVEIGCETAQGIAENIYKAIYGGQTSDDNYRVAAAVAMLKPGGLETAIINRVDTGD